MRGEATEEKLGRLREMLKEMTRVVIAYSGGVDSTFLTKVAYDVLGDDVLAITADAAIHPRSELVDAVRMAQEIGVRHEIVELSPLEDPEFVRNPPDRCYHCKRDLLHTLKEIAARWGTEQILHGENADDAGDFRPGTRAAEEMGARAPLREVGLTKAEIRSLSRRMDLPTWDRPAMACLASRFPYGTKIGSKDLKAIEDAEEFLRGLGFHQLRVRHHGDVARIEVHEEEMGRFFDVDLRRQVTGRLAALGYPYVALDLKGYRTGSLNEVLSGEGDR